MTGGYIGDEEDSQLPGIVTDACHLMTWDTVAKTATWSPLPKMNRARHAHAAAVVDSRLVVVGGYSHRRLVVGDNADSSVEMLDLSKSDVAWSYINPLPSDATNLIGTSLVAANGRLLASGGWSGRRAKSSDPTLFATVRSLQIPDSDGPPASRAWERRTNIADFSIRHASHLTVVNVD